MSDTLANLAEHFAPDEVERDPKGNHYIPINLVQNRFDEVLGTDWDLEIVDVQGPTLLPTAEVTYGSRKKPAFTGRVTVRITIFPKGRATPSLGGQTSSIGSRTSRMGVGADLADDPDKVMKTALANAIKKAGHQFGVGRYLWDEDERKAVDAAQKAAKPASTKRRPTQKDAPTGGSQSNETEDW